MSDAESWTTPTQRSCYGLFPVWSLLLSGVTNGNAKIRTGVFKCKEVGRIMTFLFSCLAIHTEAFLSLCHSGWHIINSCLICCLRALLPMQEALNPYTAVRDKTPVGQLPPHFNNKTEESSTQQRISGFLFHSTRCYSVHKCHLTRSRHISRLHIRLQIFRPALKVAWSWWVLCRERKAAPRTSEAPLHLCDPDLHQHLLPPQHRSSSLLSLRPSTKKAVMTPLSPSFSGPLHPHLQDAFSSRIH